MRTKLLIVEDNSELLELLRLNLKQAGFTVATAENGIEALRKARANPPDLVVLDLVLPELDGFAVCEAMRKDPNLAKVPLLILTGLSGELTRLTSLDSGASECVAKPVSPSLLVSKIKHWLKSPSPGPVKKPSPPPKAVLQPSGTS